MERLVRMLLLLARTGWLAVGVALLLLLLLEGVASVTLRLMGPTGDRDLPPGAPKVWYAQGPTRQLWRPYVYWRMENRRGPTMNVDADGIRHTWNAPPKGRRCVRVFMFGGSTLRGHQVRDDFTIPSYVARILARDSSTPVEVVNFGQMGYVSTQDVVTLALEVRRKNVPEVAVFYNGTVDIESAYESNEAGSPRWEYLRRNAFQDFERALALRIAQRSSLATLALRYVPGWSWAVGGIWRPPATREAFEALAQDTVDVYAGNVRLADQLARGAGFEVLHFWQPVVWSRSELSPYEEAVVAIDARRQPGRAELFREVYDRVARHPELAANPGFRDLRHAADGEGEPPFWDTTHTTERGNERIAEAIAIPLRAAIERRVRSAWREPPAPFERGPGGIEGSSSREGGTGR